MKSVLITGANGTLGQVFVKAFRAAGYKVYPTDIDELDITRPLDWWGWIDGYGVPDVLINNAAFTTNQKSEHIWSNWEKIIDVNLTGTKLGCEVIGSYMELKGTGCIINIASIYGMVSPTHYLYQDTDIVQPIAYSVSKAGVIQMTKYLACLFGGKVRVNCISPGGVYTEQADLNFVRKYAEHNPSGRMANPNEIADAALWLAHNTYVNGHNLVVDGGWTCW